MHVGGGAIINALILEDSPSVRFSIFGFSEDRGDSVGELAVEEINFNVGKIAEKTKNLSITQETRISCKTLSKIADKEGK